LTSLSVEGAIGATEIIVPSDLPVRIRVDRGLTSINASGFRGEGDLYTNPGAQGEQQALEIKVSQAIGTIILRRE
jgi:predicted membrane protein